MDLFYHVSRDIELPRTGRRVGFQMGTRACEACGEELEANEPSEGGTYGLSFCASCRDRLDRSAIQIHFCDGCGVSVPLYAVEEGVFFALVQVVVPQHRVRFQIARIERAAPLLVAVATGAAVHAHW